MDRPPRRTALAAALIRAWLDAFEEYRRGGLAAFSHRFARLDVCRGRPVRVVLTGETMTGIARGIGPDGALVVEHDGHLHEYHAAEVSLRLDDEG